MVHQEQYPTSKEILYLLGMGALLTASILMPGLGVAVKAIARANQQSQWQRNQKAWKKFNLKYLKRNLHRLHDQKVIEIIEKDGQEIIKLTQKGHSKFLKFKLEEVSLKSNSWDGKWRLVIYDVSHLKRDRQDAFRRMLKQMNFYPLQESVYLTPFKCREEIEYLREYFNLAKEVLLLEVTGLENEKYYKEFFGI